MNDALTDQILNLPAVDAHEHLRPEAVRLAKKPDVIWLFHQYALSDLKSAGMPEGVGQATMDLTIPLEQRWKWFHPFYKKIRYTGYARAVQIAIQDLYGFDRLDATTYPAISEKIQADNTPGLTDRCLGQKGHIVAILNCNYQLEQPVAYSYPLMTFPGLPRLKTRDYLQALEKSSRERITDVDTLRQACIRMLGQYHEQGVVGIKTTAGSHRDVTLPEARAALARFLAGPDTDMAEADHATVNDYLFEELLKIIPDYQFTVAVHCGYLSSNIQDFTRTHIRHMVPIILRHPGVHFDLFHLSYPWIDEAIAIGKAYPNVSLNLCWSQLLNGSATERAMVDLVNAVPVNKVLAMGGDYWELPDVAYGHLKMARQGLARALWACIQNGNITETEAIDIATCWLQTNAAGIYPLLPAK